jgi:hypothetical protein
LEQRCIAEGLPICAQGDHKLETISLLNDRKRYFRLTYKHVKEDLSEKQEKNSFVSWHLPDFGADYGIVVDSLC